MAPCEHLEQIKITDKRVAGAVGEGAMAVALAHTRRGELAVSA